MTLANNQIGPNHNKLIYLYMHFWVESCYCNDCYPNFSGMYLRGTFINVDELQSRDGKVITAILRDLKGGMNYFLHSQTSTFRPVKSAFCL